MINQTVLVGLAAIVLSVLGIIWWIRRGGRVDRTSYKDVVPADAAPRTAYNSRRTRCHASHKLQSNHEPMAGGPCKRTRRGEQIRFTIERPTRFVGAARRPRTSARNWLSKTNPGESWARTVTGTTREGSSDDLARLSMHPCTGGCPAASLLTAGGRSGGNFQRLDALRAPLWLPSHRQSRAR